MPAPRLVVLAVLSLLVGACGGDGGGAMPDGDTPTRERMGDGTADGMGDGTADGMGDGMGESLGGSASTRVLAEAPLSPVPAGPRVWVGFEVRDVEHAHAPGFVHAREATTLLVDGVERDLGPGQAAFVPEGVTHTHGTGRAWDVLLAPPDAEPPDGAEGSARFRSDVLEGVPDGAAVVRAILVELPPGADTSVHTHPGPEYVYVTRGAFVYENAVIGQERIGEGDDHTLPAGTAVQKRNGGSEPAAFLSWFVVDPDEPFAPPAAFD